MVRGNDAVFGVRLPVEMPSMPPWTSAWTALVPFAFWIVSAFKPKYLVELGVFSGVSYCSFCEEVVRARLPTRCIGVDTWQGDKHNGVYGNDVLNNLRNYHDPRYGSFSTLLPMSFDEALQHVADNTVDLLHIDGLHTYDAVRHDFETWLPKLSTTAIVLFHDIDVKRDDFGVWRFWDEVRKGKPNFAFHHSHGLGILGMGSSFPAPIEALFGASETEGDAIREVFAALGGACFAKASLGQ